jgi:hypothetical protein
MAKPEVTKMAITEMDTIIFFIFSPFSPFLTLYKAISMPKPGGARNIVPTH